jgi:hypothetical protein
MHYQGFSLHNSRLRLQASVFKDLVAGDPVNSKNPGAEQLAEMRDVCD